VAKYVPVMSLMVKWLFYPPHSSALFMVVLMTYQLMKFAKWYPFRDHCSQSNNVDVCGGNLSSGLQSSWPGYSIPVRFV
jgi:hypothetical protein